MTTRAKLSGITAAADQREKNTDLALPLLATSMFCDDVRLEATGKLSMIGCYPGNVILASPEQPVSHLWVLTKLLWHRGFDPAGLRVRVDLPAQAPGYMAVKVDPHVNDALANTALCVWQLRFHPLRIGDVLRISVEQGAAQLHCGELLAIAPTQPTRH
ncbi:MAG: hypothetical protein ACRYG8_22540 [Janthinobacterium lividum]